MSDDENHGHGHVFPRPDGFKEPCGGPGFCGECDNEVLVKAYMNDSTPLQKPLTDDEIDEAFIVACNVESLEGGRYWYVDGATLTKADVRKFVRELINQRRAT